MPEVSVVIVNHNRREMLRECLNSVDQNDLTTEVFVVDNASSDGSVEMLESEYRWVHLLRNRANERFAKPNNDAIRLATGRYILLLNNDAALCRGALRALVSYLDAHTDVGMVGPQLLNRDGSIQPSCHGFVSLRTHFFDMFLMDRLFPKSKFFASAPMTYFDHTGELEVDHVMAAAVLVRRDIMQQVGLFDEQLSVYFNDLDLSYRFSKAGWKRVFLPDARVVHHGGHTAKSMMREIQFFREQYNNIFHYYRKHYGKRVLGLYKVLLFAGFIPRVAIWSLISIFSKSERTLSMKMFAARTLQVLIGWSGSGRRG